MWPVWAQHAVPFSDTFRCQVCTSALLILLQGHVFITKPASESEVVSSLASLCMHDVLVRIPGLKDVQRRLALVTGFSFFDSLL